MSTQDVAVGTERTIASDSRRTKTIAALFELALLLEQNPDLPIPFELTDSHLNIHLMSAANPREQMAAIARMLPGPLEKDVWGHGENHYFDLKAKIGGTIDLHVGAYRDQVCERVVTGTREVTKTVPDPAVVVPQVEVTETVEDVEWVCTPLLAGSAEQ